MRIGLAANRLHHERADAALFRWLRASANGMRELGVELHAVGRTHDAIVAALPPGSLPGLKRYPNGREGGLMKLVAEIVGMGSPERTLDGAIYLIDPVDPSSVFPEAIALKRQCVIHGKPFISTVASARDWVEMERIHAGLPADPGADDLHDFGSQTLALIAHDARKPQMLAFAAEHFDVLSQFGQRIGTGTTGQRLNELAWSRGWPRDQEWIHRFQSGPLGGDQQIGALIATGEIEMLIFFIDPLTAMPHDVDVKALMRLATVYDIPMALNRATAERLADFSVRPEKAEAGFSGKANESNADGGQ